MVLIVPLYHFFKTINKNEQTLTNKICLYLNAYKMKGIADFVKLRRKQLKFTQEEEFEN